MPGIPVVIVTSRGLGVTVSATGGVSMTVATNGYGIPVMQTTNGLPVSGISFGPDVTAPTITSSNTISQPENSILNHTLTASEPVTWAKVGGADTAKFTLVGNVLTLPAKDYEAPDDADANRSYIVQVQATDLSSNPSAIQTITVTITDVSDSSIATVFSATLTSNDSGNNGYSFRGSHPCAVGAAALSQVRVRFEAGSGAGWVVSHASVGVAVGAASPPAAEATDTISTPNELLFSGVAGFSIAAGATITSDWVTLTDAFTTSSKLIVVTDITSGSQRVLAGAGHTYYKTATVSYNVADTSLWGVESINYVSGVNLIETQAGGGGGGGYPASVVTKGLQAVWDLRVGGSAGVGIRSATTKTLGVDSLAGTGFAYDGQFLTTTANGAVLSNWNLATIASNGYVETNHTATFNDCVFGYHPSTTVSYSLHPNASTTTCNYCTFDGDRLNNASVSSPFSVMPGATLIMDHCDIVDQPADGGKSNGALVATWCRWQAPGWYVGSDPDQIQVGAGTVDVQHCLFDVRDGGALGNSFPGQPLNNFFRAESFAGAITLVTFKSNICVGISGYGTLAGAYVSIDAIDVNPNAVTNVLYQDNVVQKGHNNYTYADGTTRYPHLTGAQWTGNIDYDTGATIAVP